MRLRHSFATVLLGVVTALTGSASLAVLVPPTALAASSSSAIIADCYAHPGGLTGHYTVAQLRTALQTMPPTVKEYSSCPDVVNHALLAAIATHRTQPGGSGGGSGSFLPTPVIVILVVLILIAVTFGAVAIRRRRGGGGPGTGGDGLN
jgi:hypothetical protein